HARDPLGERLALDVLHLDDPALLDLLEVVGAADVPVADLVREEDLVPQLLAPLAVFDQAVVEKLEGDLLAEDGVVRKVDRPHAAGADELLDPVAAGEPRAPAQARRPGGGRRLVHFQGVRYILASRQFAHFGLGANTGRPLSRPPAPLAKTPESARGD